MAESLNQQIADALVERQLRAGRVETTLRREAWAALMILEAEMLAMLKVADPTEFVFLTRRRRAVEALMADLGVLIAARYGRLATVMDTTMGRLATLEMHAAERIINDVGEEQIIAETPTDRQIKSRVEDALIPTATKATDLSATGTEWWERQGASLAQRIGDQLMVGVSLGESLTDLVTRVKGTPELGFQDGIMERARQDAARLVRTQVTNAVGEARAAVAERNAQQGLTLMHTSVLDSRTSSICLGRHGLRFTADTHEPIGHSIPYLTGVPYHPS